MWYEKEDYYIDLVFYNYILKCFVPIFAVSAIGRKLPTLANTSINKNFIKDVVEEFSKQNSTIKVSVHRVKSIEGTKISYEDSPLYELNGEQHGK